MYTNISSINLINTCNLLGAVGDYKQNRYTLLFGILLGAIIGMATSYDNRYTQYYVLSILHRNIVFDWVLAI